MYTNISKVKDEQHLELREEDNEDKQEQKEDQNIPMSEPELSILFTKKILTMVYLMKMVCIKLRVNRLP